MAKKDKDKEEKKAEAAPEAGEAPEKTGKKRKLVLLGGIGGVLALALGVGGFFAYKTFAGKKHDVALSAKDGKADGHAAGDAKDAKDGKADGHGDAKKDDAKADAKKDDGHGGDAKKDDAKKDDGHGGDAKKDDAKKDDGHGGDAKKDDAKKDDGHGGDAKKDDAKAGEKREEGHGDAKAGKDTREKSSGFGETYDMPKMDLNLGNPLENRFLRMGITVEYHGGDAQKDELKKREPQLKDIVITSVSSKTRMELLTEKGKERLRRELTNRFNEVLERPVKNLFFTDFLVE